MSKLFKQRCHPLLLLFSALLLPSVPTHALTIDVRYAGDIEFSTAEQAAIARAVADFEMNFVDPVTVRIEFAYTTELAENVGALTFWAAVSHPYSVVRRALIDDADTRSENHAMRRLPYRWPFVRTGPMEPAAPRDGVTIPSANAKALALGTGRDVRYPQPPAGVDGSISLNANARDLFDPDSSDGVSAGQLDFEGLVAHELGHALGFSTLIEYQAVEPDATIFPTILDLRMFDEGGAPHSIETDVRQFMPGPMEYDDGVLAGVAMSRGARVEDSFCNIDSNRCQAGHWRDNGDVRLMSPVFRGEQIVRLHPHDLIAFDYLGWDRRVSLHTSLDGSDYVLMRWIDYDGPLEDPDWPWMGAWQQTSLGVDPNTFSGYPQSNAFGSGARHIVPVAATFDLPIVGQGAAFGRVTIVDAHDNHAEIFEAPVETNGWEIVGGGEPMTQVPLRLSEFAMAGEADGGAFRILGRLSNAGATYDVTLGEHGGFRVPCAIDLESDGYGTEVFDTDVRVVLLLAFSESPDFDEGVSESLQLHLLGDMPDAVIRLIDAAMIEDGDGG